MTVSETYCEFNYHSEFVGVPCLMTITNIYVQFYRLWLRTRMTECVSNV